MIFQSPLPDHVMLYSDLFKYRPLRHESRKGENVGPEHEFTKLIFENKALWFSTPSAFNDPFDCNICISTDRVPENLYDQARKEFASQHPDLPMERLEAGINAVNLNPKIFDSIFEKQRRQIYEKSSAFCWAGSGNNISMFAYYADSHRGICLQYRIEHRHPLGQTRAVNYELNYPKLNYADLVASDPGSLAKYLMFSKAKCWEHEQERRVFRYKEAAGLVNFEPSQLVRIIFGAKCPSEDIELVKGWLNGWPTPVILAKAEPEDAVFTLRLIDFETAGTPPP